MPFDHEQALDSLVMYHTRGKFAVRNRIRIKAAAEAGGCSAKCGVQPMCMYVIVKTKIRTTRGQDFLVSPYDPT